LNLDKIFFRPEPHGHLGHVTLFLFCHTIFTAVIFMDTCMD